MRDRYRKIIAACGVVTLLSLGTAAVATAQTYTITDVGEGGSIFSFNHYFFAPEITAINNLGQVVGQSITTNEAYLWQNGVVTNLGTLGGTFSDAFGINDAGQVVGQTTIGGIEIHAYRWQNDAMTDLNLCCFQSRAFGINAAGQVVGTTQLSNVNFGVNHAFLWQDGHMTDLGTLGAPACCDVSQALAVNNTGQVVGESVTANREIHAFLWQNGVMTDLGTLGDQSSSANWINDAGQVVGYTQRFTFSGPTQAFLWQNGAMTALGTVGGSNSNALSINAAGQIVGVSDTPDGIRRATLWQKDPQGVYRITDLNTLLPPDSGWTLVAARAINDRGQIIGVGEFNGVNHRYLLSPVEILDPVPELLSGAEVTTDAERLAKKGRPVQGVAADGVARVVIRIPAKSVGEQIMLTVLNAQQVESFAKDEDGAVADVNNPLLFTSSVTVQAQNTSLGPMAFALYLAPKDFVRNCGSGLCQSYVDASTREINVQINGSSTFPIKIVRSPVLLIHGLWGQQSGWDGFKLVTDPRFKVFRADYKETNGESFEVNTSNVEAELDLDLREFKSVSKVAAVQFDLVTHSMGGLLARKLATLPFYERSTNYRQGDIHKLITLDTPHLGSQFANRLEASSPLCKFIFNRIGKKIGGAVRDLQYGSPAIAQLLELRTPIKARLIAGQATKLQEDMSAAIFVGVPPLNAVNAVCGPLLTLPGGFPEVFQTQDDPDGRSDLIVSVVSQVGKTIAVGRQDPPADSPYIGIEHTKVPVLFPGPSPLDDADIGQRVIDLLNTPVSIIDFGDILP